MLLSQRLRFTGIGLVLLSLAIGPFFRGLFFWTELLTALALVARGFVLWLVGRRSGRLPTTLPGGWTGAAVLALLGCYLLQFAWAVFPRGNLDWTLRVAAAWFAYVMVRAEAGPVLRQWLGWTFTLSAAAVGLLGFLEYTGDLLKDPALAEKLALVNLSTRMFTTFQYPNAAAAYFLAALLTAGKVGLLGSEAHVWLYAIDERRGDTVAMAELEEKPWIRFRNANPVYKALLTWE